MTPDDTRITRWLATTREEITPSESGRVLASVLTQIPTTSQRAPGRRFGLRPHSTSYNHWRVPSMFSASRIVAVFAIATLGGSVLLLSAAQPRSVGPAGGSAMLASPSASPAPMRAAVPPVAFTGQISFGGQVRAETTETVGDHVENRGGAWQTSVISISDDRLDGDVTISFDTDEYKTSDGSSYVVGSGTWRITTADGAWQGSYPIVSTDEFTSVVTTTLVGEGAYDGMTVVWEQTLTGSSWSIRGVIFPAAPPAPPTAP